MKHADKHPHTGNWRTDVLHFAILVATLYALVYFAAHAGDGYKRNLGNPNREVKWQR